MTRGPKPLRSTARRRNAGAVTCALCAAALLVALLSGSALGEERLASGFALIVNPANPTQSVSQDFVSRAFFKRTTRWDHGELIHPVDQHLSTPVRIAFSSEVLKRSATAVRGYWLQRLFSGRDVPPPELDSDAAVIRYVMATPGAIGYVAASTNAAPAKVLTLR